MPWRVLAGTFALQGILVANRRLAPGTLPPIRQDPAAFLLGKAKSVLTPEQRAWLAAARETALEKALHLGYGVSFGMLYGVAGDRRRGLLLGGGLFGLATWATGYLGWLPASALMPPVTAGVTAAAYGWVRRRLYD